MTETEGRPIIFRKKRGTLTAMRNDGACWGRIVLDGGTKYDVWTKTDHYDKDDDDALDRFERAMKRPDCVTPAESWL